MQSKPIISISSYLILTIRVPRRILTRVRALEDAFSRPGKAVCRRCGYKEAY